MPPKVQKAETITDLDECAIPAPDHEFQLSLHGQRTDDRRLDRTNQVALLAVVLKHHCKGIIALHSLLPKCPGESCYTGRLAEQEQSLIQTVSAKPIEHSLSRNDVRRRPATDPFGVVHVVVVLELSDLSQAIRVDNALKRAEVRVIAAVLKDRQDFAGLLGRGDQLVCFGRRSSEWLFYDDYDLLG